MVPLLALLLLVAAALGALATLAGFWIYRVSVVGHRLGTFRCWVGNSPEGPWRSGIALYETDRLTWWPRFFLGGVKRWPRESLGVVSRSEVGDLLPGRGPMLVLRCQTVEACRPCPDLYLLLDTAAADGVTSWLEARPGRPHRVI